MYNIYIVPTLHITLHHGLFELLIQAALSNPLPFLNTFFVTGQRFNPRTNLPENPNIPREIFTVKKGGYYRFRIANSGMDLPFKISIDEHMLHVIASDGNAVTTTTGTHLVVASGETYDVYIKADDSDGSGNYWIRGETLEYMDADDKVRISLRRLSPF